MDLLFVLELGGHYKIEREGLRSQHPVFDSCNYWMLFLRLHYLLRRKAEIASIARPAPKSVKEAGSGTD
jgi:hypothetical protein